MSKFFDEISSKLEENNFYDEIDDELICLVNKSYDIMGQSEKASCEEVRKSNPYDIPLVY